MYWKHKLHVYFFCVMIAAQPGFSKSILESIKDLLSFKVPENIFDAVNESIVGKLNAKNIKFIVPNKIEMDDVEVLDERGARVLYGKHATLTISLISLLTNNIRITDAYVDSPFFRYTIINGVHNVISPFNSPPRVSEKAETSTSSSSKMRVTIERVRVENGSYEMFHDAGVEIFAEGIKAFGSFWVESGPFGVDIDQVTIERGAILAGGMDLPITNLVSKKLFISHERVSTENLVAKYEKANLFGRGTVFISEERYDINARLDAPAGTYPSGLKPLPFITPAFNAVVKMTGPLTVPEFLIDFDHRDTDFRGLKINNGKARARLNPKKLVVDSSTLSVGTKGKIVANGVVNFAKGTFHFSSKETNILVEELARFLSLQEKSAGVVNAESIYDGSFKGGHENIKITTLGTIVDGAINEITLAKESQFDVETNFVFDKSVAINKAKIADKFGLHLNVNGNADIKNKALALGFDLKCENVKRYYPLAPDSLAIFGLKSTGDIYYDDDGLRVVSDVFARRLDFAQIRGNNVQADITYDDKKLHVVNATADVYTGTLSADITVSDFTNGNEIAGTATIAKIDLHPLGKQFSKLPLSGRLSASLKLGGTISNPQFSFLTEIEELMVDRVSLKSSQLEGEFSKNQLTVSKLIALLQSGMLESSDLFIDISNRKIGGSINVSRANVATIFHDYSDKIAGELNGTIFLDGTLTSPSITAPLTARRLRAFGIKFGEGAITLAFAKRPLLGRVVDEDLVFSLSANLAERESETMARFSYALNRKTLNADINFNGMELNTVELGLLKQYFGILGRVSGNVIAEGPIDAPVLRAKFSMKEYGFFDPNLREETILIKKWRGPFVVYASSKNQTLKLDLCASLLDASLNQECSHISSFMVSLSGPFGFDQFALDVKGSLEHSHLEEVILPLRHELITLDGASTFRGKLIKKKNAALAYRANVQLDRIILTTPNIPQISLKEPVDIFIEDGHFALDKEAVLLFSPGQLAINGSYAENAIDLHFRGEIPLILMRPFVPLVQRADGLASGTITLSGSKDALMAEGKIRPEPGSTIALKKWIDPIEVKEGTILFHKTSANSFKTEFEKIRLTVGDGKLSLNGSFDKSYQSSDEINAATFNLDLQGNNIIVRDRLDFVEADFKIHTVQNAEGNSIASGEIVVTDGAAHRQFDLRNFVAEVRTTSRANLARVLNAINMGVAIDIGVRQFKASARMLNLDIDANLRGQMTLTGSLAQPKFKGALAVSEGAIMFPSTSFDLVESQIELDETSAKPFDPKINIVATQDLDRENYFPHIRNDTTIQLTLKGNMDKLSLELVPIRGDMRLSQFKIFLLLVSPRSIAGFEERDQYELLRRSAQNAIAAFSGEVFLRPLTNELQELLAGQTKTRIQFGSALEPDGVTLRMNWKLGPRIELQGSYMFLTDEARTGGGERSILRENYPLGDLKLKLLLFDHKPAGPLSLETSFGSTKQIDGRYEPRGKIRLKYRVLQK